MIGFSEEPAAPFGAKLDKAAFLAWVQAQEGRYELKDGAIVMHAGSTRRHAQVCAKFIAGFVSRLDANLWAVTTADFAVEIGDDVRYPDALVEAAAGLVPNAVSTSQPVLLLEVLSPSSADRDLNVKVDEYTSLPSLQCYIVASQDEPIVWVWQRDTSGAFANIAMEIKGLDGVIEIEALSLSLPLAEIYRGMT